MWMASGGLDASVSSVKGRAKYTLDEDYAMYQFLVRQLQQRNVDAKTPFGNQLWQLAVIRNVTSHSMQSMRDRARRHLLDPMYLAQAAIPDDWRNYLATKYSLNVAAAQRKLERDKSRKQAAQQPPPSNYKAVVVERNDDGTIRTLGLPRRAAADPGMRDLFTTGSSNSRSPGEAAEQTDDVPSTSGTAAAAVVVLLDADVPAVASSAVASSSSDSVTTTTTTGNRHRVVISVSESDDETEEQQPERPREVTPDSAQKHSTPEQSPPTQNVIQEMAALLQQTVEAGCSQTHETTPNRHTRSSEPQEPQMAAPGSVRRLLSKTKEGQRRKLGSSVELATPVAVAEHTADADAVADASHNSAPPAPQPPPPPSQPQRQTSQAASLNDTLDQSVDISIDTDSQASSQTPTPQPLNDTIGSSSDGFVPNSLSSSNSNTSSKQQAVTKDTVPACAAAGDDNAHNLSHLPDTQCPAESVDALPAQSQYETRSMATAAKRIRICGQLSASVPVELLVEDTEAPVPDAAAEQLDDTLPPQPVTATSPTDEQAEAEDVSLYATAPDSTSSQGDDSAAADDTLRQETAEQLTDRVAQAEPTSSTHPATTNTNQQQDAATQLSDGLSAVPPDQQDEAELRRRIDLQALASGSWFPAHVMDNGADVCWADNVRQIVFAGAVPTASFARAEEFWTSVAGLYGQLQPYTSRDVPVVIKALMAAFPDTYDVQHSHAALGFADTQTLRQHLNQLCRQGALTRRRRKQL